MSPIRLSVVHPVSQSVALNTSSLSQSFGWTVHAANAEVMQLVIIKSCLFSSRIKRFLQLVKHPISQVVVVVIFCFLLFFLELLPLMKKKASGIQFTATSNLFSHQSSALHQSSPFQLLVSSLLLGHQPVSHPSFIRHHSPQSSVLQLSIPYLRTSHQSPFPTQLSVTRVISHSPSLRSPVTSVILSERRPGQSRGAQKVTLAADSQFLKRPFS